MQYNFLLYNMCKLHVFNKYKWLVSCLLFSLSCRIPTEIRNGTWDPTEVEAFLPYSNNFAKKKLQLVIVILLYLNINCKIYKDSICCGTPVANTNIIMLLFNEQGYYKTCCNSITDIFFIFDALFSWNLVFLAILAFVFLRSSRSRWLRFAAVYIFFLSKVEVRFNFSGSGIPRNKTSLSESLQK